LMFLFTNPALACIGAGASCTVGGEACCCGSCTAITGANVSVCQGSCTTNTSSFFGQISPPPGIASYNHGGVEGIVTFANNILKFVITIGGVLTFLNILLAGFAFVTAAGDPKKIEQAWNKIWQSILGLAVMAASFVIAAIVGWVLFKDPLAILSPKIYGPP